MKRFLCVLCVLMLLSPIAIAEKIDLSSMTVEELTDLRDKINEEIAKRTTDGYVLYENENIRIVYVEHKIQNEYYYDNPCCSVHFKVTNKSDKTKNLTPYSTFAQYQNGVSLKVAMLVDGFETSLSIRAGATADIYFVCELKDTKTDVEVTYRQGLQDVAQMMISIK